MATEDEFTSHLIEFGLSQKEALLYQHLLKYGPKTPSPLAKSLHTYREDVHRTLQNLIDKGMVRPSLDSPTLYAAVDIHTALESAVKKYKSELHEMEARKQQLQELSKKQQFRPSEEISTFTIIKSMKELTGMSLSAVASIKEEQVFIFPAKALSIGAQAGIIEAFKTLVNRGVHVRGVIDIACHDPACTDPQLVQELLDGGVDVRYIDQYRGLYFSVSDRKTSASILYVDVERTSLSAPISVLWVDDRTYAESLISNFELLWAQAVPAAHKIQELLEGRSLTLSG
ncbi:MAG: TrmB family transcriptional regulator [Halobacteriota archaeon]